VVPNSSLRHSSCPGADCQWAELQTVFAFCSEQIGPVNGTEVALGQAKVYLQVSLGMFGSIEDRMLLALALARIVAVNAGRLCRTERFRDMRRTAFLAFEALLPAQ
jgi:hypothetical protein